MFHRLDASCVCEHRDKASVSHVQQMEKLLSDKVDRDYVELSVGSKVNKDELDAVSTTGYMQFYYSSHAADVCKPWSLKC